MSDDNCDEGDRRVEAADDPPESRTGERLVTTVQLPAGAAEFLASVGE